MYPTSPIDPDVVGGSYNADVVKLQTWLLSQGWASPAEVAAIQQNPGFYGPATKAAIARMQTAYGVSVGAYPGYWGKATLTKINANPTLAGTQPKATITPPPPPPATPITTPPATPITTPPTTPITTPPTTPITTPPTTPITTPPTTPITTPPATTLTPPTSTLQFGDSNADVKKLQEWLISLGYKIPDGPTNYFGAQTMAALNQFQADNKIDTQGNPGYWGPITRAFVTAGNYTYPTKTGYAAVPAPVITDPSGNTIPPPPGAPAPVITPPAGEEPPAGTDSTTPKPPVSNAGHYQYDKNTPNKSLEAGNIEALGFYGGKAEAGIAELAGMEKVISQDALTKIASRPDLLAFYIHAVTYGGYNWGDILKDMKRQELIYGGNKAAESIKVIDPDVDRNTYYASEEGIKNANLISSTIPNVNVGTFANMDILQYGLNMPDELFKKIVPIADVDSPEYKDAVAHIKSMYFDLVQTQLDAGIGQAKAMADYNMAEFKKQIAEKYGIILSDNSTKAWSQLEALDTSYAGKNLLGSGLQQEEVDQTLAQTRKADQRSRTSRLTAEEAQKAAYYTSSASAAEIAALTPEERQKYGLTPSQDIINSLSFEAMKAKYPKESDDAIRRKIDSIITKNPDGTYSYRSTIYAKYFGDTASTAEARQTSAEGEVDAAQAKKIADAQTALDKSQPYSDMPAGPTEGLAAAGTAAGAMGTGSTTGSTSTTGTTATPMTGTSNTPISPNFTLPADFSTNAGAYIFDPVKGFIKKPL